MSLWQVVLDLSSSRRNATYKLGFYRLSVILSVHSFPGVFKLESFLAQICQHHTTEEK